jgi:hypothetical protein
METYQRPLRFREDREEPSQGYTPYDRRCCPVPANVLPPTRLDYAVLSKGEGAEQDRERAFR